MYLGKRLLIATTAMGVGMALLSGVLLASSANPFSSDTKSLLPITGPKGSPIPAAAVLPAIPGEEWIIVPPESRTDIQMIDVTDARLFLPSPGEAAGCESGDMDAAKAEEVIRTWLAHHRAELPHTSVWDQTLIGVICSYPNSDFPGKVVLNIGIPYLGHAYIAPAICQNKAKNLLPSDPPPAECLTPPGLEPPPDVTSYSIVVSPAEVLK